jgi:hypothetical protein
VLGILNEVVGVQRRVTKRHDDVINRKTVFLRMAMWCFADKNAKKGCFQNVLFKLSILNLLVKLAVDDTRPVREQTRFSLRLIVKISEPPSMGFGFSARLLRGTSLEQGEQARDSTSPSNPCHVMHTFTSSSSSQAPSSPYCAIT